MTAHPRSFAAICRAAAAAAALNGGLTLAVSPAGPVSSAEATDPGWVLALDASPSRLSPPWSIARMSSERDTSRLMASVERVAAKSDNPARTRRSLLLAMQMSSMCYAPDLPQQELDDLIAATGLRPVTLLGLQDRFNIDSTVWSGDGGQGSRGKSTRARLTYSFAPDGTTWGNDADFFSFPNSLNSALITNFGVQDTGREWVRQGLAAWKNVAGVELDEVGDSVLVAMDNVTARRSTVGDVRIGGNVLFQTNGQSNLAGVLAYNFFPNGGSDMLIDTAEFTASRFNNSDNNFRYFRNVVAHEHGHGLGFIHQVPCNNTKLMEPLVSTSYDVLQIDDKRGAGTAYGDRFSGNSSAATAADLGQFRTPALPARLVRDLSIARQNGPVSGPDPNAPNAVDWFKFTINTAQSITIGMTPTGGTYSTGPQQTDPNNANNACFGSSGSINATSAIDLDVELIGTNGTTVLASSANGAGQSDFITQFLNPGTYFIRVFSFTADPGSAVQLYDLLAGFTGGLYVPEANAGLNKRINVGEFCQFIGDVNTVPGLLPIASYQWDLDGNGTLEVVGEPRPVTVYSIPGIRRVRMVAVDSNNGNGNDFINVTVIGNGPSVTSVSPSTVTAGTTVPITINGSFLGSPTVTLSAFGIAVTGTPSVDLTNPSSPITGLSLVVDQVLPIGTRDLTVTTPSGTFTLANAFTVVQPPTTITSLTPATGAAGQTVPIVINGTNFRFANSPTISGTGASLTGTPNVNAAFNQITGLSVVIAPNAAAGPRTISVIALGGTGTATFNVTLPVPGNDLCGNAANIALGATLNGTNVGAGTEGSSAQNCATSGTNSDVFYSFTAPCTTSYRFETGPASFDTVLTVHTACPASAANSIACNDDIAPGSNLGSRVDVNLTAGTNYLIRVASFGTRPQGAFTISALPTTPLANDACTGAANLPIGPTAIDNCLAVTESVTFVSCASTAKDLWYQYTPSSSGRTTIETCGSSFDTVLEVFSSACGSTTQAIACDDDFCIRSSRVVFPAVAGTTYRIRLSGFASSNTTGSGTLTRYCPADMNLSGSVTVQDIFDFLAAYFAGNTAADFNSSGALSVQDIFDFLASYFSGC